MAQMLNHAVHRLMERTEQEVSRKEIIRAIENRQMVFAKKMTNSRSLVYVHTVGGITKIILHKPTGKVVTVLPWKARYKFITVFESETYKGTIEAEIYPDCYMETNCKTALSKIVRIHGDGAKEPIGFNHPLFEPLFNEIWKRFKEKDPDGIKEVNLNDKVETKAKGTDCGESNECTINFLQPEGTKEATGTH
jgi:hypothetical protein